MDEDLRSIVDDVYAEILKTTSNILSNCKFFQIELLQLEDPTYECIAEQITETAELIEGISSAYPSDQEGIHTANKAKEYAHTVMAIARAIRRGNEEELKKLTLDLDGRPFL